MLCFINNVCLKLRIESELETWYVEILCLWATFFFKKSLECEKFSMSTTNSKTLEISLGILHAWWNWLLGERLRGLSLLCRAHASACTNEQAAWGVCTSNDYMWPGHLLQREMASRSTAQRPNGATQGKICQFKLVLLGESAVGKSSLVLRFVKGQFHEYQESTIGGIWLTKNWTVVGIHIDFEFGIQHWNYFVVLNEHEQFNLIEIEPNLCHVWFWLMIMK
jgi:hypothetical protein